MFAMAKKKNLKLLFLRTVLDNINHHHWSVFTTCPLFLGTLRCLKYLGQITFFCRAVCNFHVHSTEMYIYFFYKKIKWYFIFLASELTKYFTYYIVYNRVHPLYCKGLMGFDKYIMSYNHHYGIIQNSFNDLCISHIPSILPFFPLSKPTETPGLYTVSTVLPISEYPVVGYR